MKQLLRRSLAASAVLLATAVPAFADSLYYEIGSGSSVTAYNPPPPDNGLVIETYVENIAGHGFWLDDWEHEMFAFFDIWTNETHVNPDDKTARDISATLIFSVPDASATVEGKTVGASLLGFLQAGHVSWDGPAVIEVADRHFSVTLTDEVFNLGLFGLNEGYKYGATVKAKVKQLASWDPAISSVPTPSAALGGLVLIGGIVVSRRRFA